MGKLFTGAWPSG